jgi:hypothetical protein
MSIPPLHRSGALYLSWIGGLCGAVILLLADVLPFAVSFATPASFLTCIVELEIAFVLLVWPLFVPGMLREGCAVPMILLHVGVLLLFALPLVLIGANVAGAGAASVLRGQVLVGALAALGAGVAARFRAALPGYLLGVFWFSAAHPFWSFLADQMGAGSPGGAAYLSPFWGAATSLAAPAWVQAAAFGVPGMLLLALAGRRASA